MMGTLRKTLLPGHAYILPPRRLTRQATSTNQVLFSPGRRFRLPGEVLSWVNATHLHRLGDAGYRHQIGSGAQIALIGLSFF